MTLGTLGRGGGGDLHRGSGGAACLYEIVHVDLFRGRDVRGSASSVSRIFFLVGTMLCMLSLCQDVLRAFCILTG